MEPGRSELSENRRWHSIFDLLGNDDKALVALIGAPLAERSLTPGRCDLAPQILRQTLKRLSTYDVETRTNLAAISVFDAGDLNLRFLPPEEAFEPIRKAVAAQRQTRALTILSGGNNAITRPGVHGVDTGLKHVGVLTLDAHFDLRDTDLGLNNGNPIQALLDDGLPGPHISQIGLAPFANTKKAHGKASAAGIAVHTLADCRRYGLISLVRDELARLSRTCDVIYVDFDIDALDRAHMPAAAGARPGGLALADFLAAARLVASHPKVVAVDLAEFDPSLDVSDIGALTAARWFAELLTGLLQRSGPLK